MSIGSPWRSLRLAARGLRKTPGFTALALLTLAAGIGANTAIFSVVYGILLRPLPYRDAGRLVVVRRQQTVAGSHAPVAWEFTSPDDAAAWKQRLGPVGSTAFYATAKSALTTRDGTDLIETAIVSGDFFSTLGGPIAAGRALAPADTQADAVVISERLARRAFGSPAAALGRHLSFSSQSYAVVGVATESFQFPRASTDAWMPVSNPGCCGFSMVARLQPGVTTSQAGAKAEALAQSLESTAARGKLHARVVSLRDVAVDGVRPALLVLFAAAGLMLLVACANIASLLLVRHAARSREFAVRWALGASRARLALESMAESALLALTGAAAGMLLAAAAVAVLQRANPTLLPRLDAVRVDWPVMLFSAAIATLAALAAGLAPALGAAGAAASLKTGAGGGMRRARRALCVAELAIAIVLLVSASLLGRSLDRLLHTDLGVSSDHVVTASLNVAFGSRPKDAETVARIGRVLDRVSMLPGVRAAGVGTSIPPSTSRLRITLKREGDSIDYAASMVAATPGYFDALKMRLLKGRLFTADDDLDHPPVMIMTVDTAKRFFGPADPIGRTMHMPGLRDGVSHGDTMTLVGVVSDVKYAGLDAAPDDAVYRPFTQQAWIASFLVVRTAGDPGVLVPTIRRAAADVDPTMVVSDVAPLDSIVSRAADQPRFRAVLLGAIAGLALLMAIVGLYGVVSQSVAQRTREIGIRVALGATPGVVGSMVLKDGLQLAVAGMVVGAGAAWETSRLLAGFLYGVGRTDLFSFALPCAGLALIAVAASYVPARRALQVNPATVLRLA